MCVILNMPHMSQFLSQLFDVDRIDLYYLGIRLLVLLFSSLQGVMSHTVIHKTIIVVKLSEDILLFSIFCSSH